jgi:hypothetical protein
MRGSQNVAAQNAKTLKSSDPFTASGIGKPPNLSGTTENPVKVF